MMSNDLFKLAIKATTPIITVNHSDILHVGTVLEAVLGTAVTQYPLSSGDIDPSKASIAKSKLSTKSIFYSTNPEFKCNDAIYNWFAENDKSLILVNIVDKGYAFDAGTLTLPKEYFPNLLGELLDETTIELITPILQGLTIKAISELIRITTAQYGNVTVRNLTKNRSLVTSGVQGLSKVDCTIPVYAPNVELQAYIDLNKDYFINKNTPDALVPRGLLLNGLAGVGKSLAAKHISNTFDAPLYRLDLSASLSKFVGSSERNLAAILAAVEQEPSAVLLLDEAEKIFSSGGDDSGVTTRLLSQLLWFLQEHKSRTFFVITTNDMSKLPPELYRQGRIDQVLTLAPLNLQETYSLAFKVAEQFFELDTARKNTIKAAIDTLQGDNNFTPAIITGTVHTLIKKNKWLNA